MHQWEKFSTEETSDYILGKAASVGLAPALTSYARSIQMCSHTSPAYPITKPSDFRCEPTEPDRCHIYYIHPDDSMFCEPNVAFNASDDSAKGNATFRGNDRLTLMSV